jgi:hypothetical protein
MNGRMGRTGSRARAHGPTQTELGTESGAARRATVAMAAIGGPLRPTLVGPASPVAELRGSFAAFAKSLLLIHRWWPLGMERSQLI